MIYYYFIEIVYRLIYILISWIFCSILLVKNIYILLIFETYPFLKFYKKKFIVTHTMDLFNIIWILVISTSLIFIFPFVIYHLFQFSKVGWYSYQIILFKKLYVWAMALLFSIGVILYISIIPFILKFLIQWENLYEVNSILNIDIELRLLYYIYWILWFHYSFSSISFFCVIIIIQIWFLTKITKIYLFFKYYRKQLAFVTIFCIFLIIPPEIFLQFIIIIIILAFYEIVFLCICYKIVNFNIH